MKRFFTNSFFVLGGIYFVLSSLFAFIFQDISENNLVQIFDFLLLILFLFFAIRIYFNKDPKFMTSLQHKAGKISAYLASIGWIPYISALYFASMLVMTKFDWFNFWLDSVFEGIDIANFFAVVVPTVQYIIISLCLLFASYYNFFIAKKTT